MSEDVVSSGRVVVSSSARYICTHIPPVVGAPHVLHGAAPKRTSRNDQKIATGQMSPPTGMVLVPAAAAMASYLAAWWGLGVLG